MKNIVVIDNFYSNPWAVREYALNKAQYISKENLPGEFPGTESKQSFFTPGVVEKMELAIGQKITPEPANYSFGVFAKTYAKDLRNKSIHVDSSDWTGLLYLSRPEDCRGGTNFYSHKDSGLDQVPSDSELLDMGFSSKNEFIEKFLKPIGQEPSQWNVSVKVGMKFNRMLLFKAGELFHSADSYFGDSDNNCRLIQLFFFKTYKEV